MTANECARAQNNWTAGSCQFQTMPGCAQRSSQVLYTRSALGSSLVPPSVRVRDLARDGRGDAKIRASARVTLDNVRRARRQPWRALPRARANLLGVLRQVESVSSGHSGLVLRHGALPESLITPDGTAGAREPLAKLCCMLAAVCCGGGRHHGDP